MCGIVGVIPKKGYGFDNQSQGMFYQALFCDQVRGDDATGVITITKDGDFGINKEASSADAFLPQFIGTSNDKMAWQRGWGVIGHNRKKTVGKNIDVGAHPFVVDKTFAMVHNGTLYSHKHLADTDVDSEALAIAFKKAFDEENWKKALEETLDKVHGAYAVAFFDQKRMQMGLLRNKERPLSICECDDAILFGSELPMLQWIAWRNGMKIQNSQQLAEHELWLYNIDSKPIKETRHPLVLSPVKSTGATYSGSTGTVTKKETSPFASVVKRALGMSTNKDTEVSKNEYKRIKKDLMGTKVPFKADDWVERYIESPNSPEVILMGKIPLLTWNHDVKAFCNLTDYSFSVKDVESQGGVMLTGTVSNVEYHASTRSVSIVFTNIEESEIETVLH